LSPSKCSIHELRREVKPIVDDSGWFGLIWFGWLVGWLLSC
jgi:hypothetical protein